MKAVWVSEMFCECGEARGLQSRRSHVGHAYASARGHSRQSAPTSLLQGTCARARGPARSEYRRLVDEIIPSQLSYSGFQAVLKLLLSERVSIRNLHLILEAIAEIAPHVRRAEQLAEHVRMRMAQQICGDLTDGVCSRCCVSGNRWASRVPSGAESGMRRAKSWNSISIHGSSSSSDKKPRKPLRGQLDQGHQFVLVSATRRPALCPHGDRASVPDACPCFRILKSRAASRVSALGSIS